MALKFNGIDCRRVPLSEKCARINNKTKTRGGGGAGDGGRGRQRRSETLVTGFEEREKEARKRRDKVGKVPYLQIDDGRWRFVMHGGGSAAVGNFVVVGVT